MLLAVGLASVASVENADHVRRSAVFVDDAVVPDPYPVQMLSADELATACRDGVCGQLFDCGDDARNLLAVYAAQVTLSRALPFNAAG